MPRDAGFETLAGFILARLQRIPTLRDSFEYEGRRYTVEELEGHRIARVQNRKDRESRRRSRSGEAGREIEEA